MLILPRGATRIVGRGLPAGGGPKTNPPGPGSTERNSTRSLLF